MAKAGPEDAPAEIIPAGYYDVVVKNAKVAWAKSSGNKMYNLVLEVESGPYAKTTLFTRLVFATTEKGAESLLKQMKALGVTREFLGTAPDDDIILAKITGQRASANVVEKDAEGDWPAKNEVRWLNVQTRPAPAGAAAAAPTVGAAPPVARPAAAAPAVGAAPPVTRPAPPVAAPAPAADADPWAVTPPVMGGLGDDPEAF